MLVEAVFTEVIESPAAVDAAPGADQIIDKTSRQLKQAIEDGKTIIGTTLQKFPVIAKQMGAMKGKKFAVLVDEAHSSQSGDRTKTLKEVLTAKVGSVSSLQAVRAQEHAEAWTPNVCTVKSLADADKQDAAKVEDLEDRIVAEIQTRGRLPNVSYSHRKWCPSWTRIWRGCSFSPSCCGVCFLTSASRCRWKCSVRLI